MITVLQVHAFMEAVNAGRQAYGLEPISELEFDDCKPNNSHSCFSARHLLVPIGGRAVLDTTFAGVPDAARLAEAIDAEVVDEDEDESYEQVGGVVIPPSIKEVTDEFDRLPYQQYEGEYGTVDLSSPKVKEFRQVLVEAGVVKD